MKPAFYSTLLAASFLLIPISGHSATISTLLLGINTETTVISEIALPVENAGLQKQIDQAKLDLTALENASTEWRLPVLKFPDTSNMYDHVSMMAEQLKSMPDGPAKIALQALHDEAVKAMVRITNAWSDLHHKILYVVWEREKFVKELIEKAENALKNNDPVNAKLFLDQANSSINATFKLLGESVIIRDILLPQVDNDFQRFYEIFAEFGRGFHDWLTGKNEAVKAG